jgi:hypothetical protein
VKKLEAILGVVALIAFGFLPVGVVVGTLWPGKASGAIFPLAIGTIFVVGLIARLIENCRKT